MGTVHNRLRTIKEDQSVANSMLATCSSKYDTQKKIAASVDKLLEKQLTADDIRNIVENMLEDTKEHMQMALVPSLVGSSLVNELALQTMLDRAVNDLKELLLVEKHDDVDKCDAQTQSTLLPVNTSTNNALPLSQELQEVLSGTDVQSKQPDTTATGMQVSKKKKRNRNRRNRFKKNRNDVNSTKKISGPQPLSKPVIDKKKSKPANTHKQSNTKSFGYVPTAITQTMAPHTSMPIAPPFSRQEFLPYNPFSIPGLIHTEPPTVIAPSLSPQFMPVQTISRLPNNFYNPYNLSTVPNIYPSNTVLYPTSNNIHNLNTQFSRVF
jgi:hypothetical protein